MCLCVWGVQIPLCLSRARVTESGPGSNNSCLFCESLFNFKDRICLVAHRVIKSWKLLFFFELAASYFNVNTLWCCSAFVAQRQNKSSNQLHLRAVWTGVGGLQRGIVPVIPA